ncbi:MAG: hypothetical protein QOE93_2067 [Actinomycetota bacterium]|jgi:hypothetical protein|nr:hypothetical protein [Actinomycetota bacterium]
MGEVFNALEVMNRTMKLGLSAKDLLRAEMGFKSALAMQGNPDPTLPTDPVALAEGFEVVATIRPRAETKTLNELSVLAAKEVSRPRTKVEAKTFKSIDKALGALPVKGGKIGTGQTPATGG